MTKLKAIVSDHRQTVVTTLDCSHRINTKDVNYLSKRAIIIVLDSVGIGEMPDAAEFGDANSDTLGHIIQKRGHLDVPNMNLLGLNVIDGISFKINHECSGCYGKAAERTLAKDTTSGHWEIAGIVMDKPFRTFPDGFPKRILEQFEERIGRKTIGNIAISGTEILERLGDEHVKTGAVIVYTSADSVFQIAAHEEVVPLAELYSICEAAREMLMGDDAVGRVIARPFAGHSGSYKRTPNRRDYALPPPTDTILDALLKANKRVAGVGKIEDIFCHRGVSDVNHTTNNAAGIEATIDFIKQDIDGLIFTNLVDFDMLYGHRNDVEGYAKALEYFDAKLPAIMDAMKQDDLLIITADHGCDPTTASTDHSREYIPLLVYGKSLKSNVNLGIRNTFADIGATVYDYLGCGKWPIGVSFANKLV